MVEFFSNLNPIYQALIAGIFTWFITLLGASLVFFFKNNDNIIMDIALSQSAGIMLSASIFSLIIPALEIATELNYINYIIVSIGMLLGVFVIYLGEKIYDYYFKKQKKEIISSKKRCTLLITSIFLHNIPEGLIIGLSFGSLTYKTPGISIISALMLTLGIGIQNFPEGSAVSLPLLREGYSKKKAFFIGQLSAIVEPISAVIGALLVTKIKSLLPLLLASAAGAMFFVVFAELLPESAKKNKNIATISTIIGFIIMMILDVALG